MATSTDFVAITERTGHGVLIGPLTNDELLDHVPNQRLVPVPHASDLRDPKSCASHGETRIEQLTMPSARPCAPMSRTVRTWTMSSGDLVEDGLGSTQFRTVSCDLSFTIAEPAEVILQVVASATAGHVDDKQFTVTTDGQAPVSVDEIVSRDGATMQVVATNPGRLSVHYRSQISPTAQTAAPLDHAEFDRQVYLRPSRYCPSDHLVGFAVAEFGTGPDVGARVGAISEWIRHRTGYVTGSSSVHDSAEDTLLTGVGTCRDFAHLGIVLCRATGVPARFAAVYAPGLSPMDFHAVFEAYQDGVWRVYDATGLAPRQSLVRIATGRDAADTAFAAVTRGIAELDEVVVSATVSPSLPLDDQTGLATLA